MKNLTYNKNIATYDGRRERRENNRIIGGIKTSKLMIETSNRIRPLVREEERVKVKHI